MAEVSLHRGERLRDAGRLLRIADLAGCMPEPALEPPLFGLQGQRVSVASRERLVETVQGGVAGLQREQRTDVVDEDGEIVRHRSLRGSTLDYPGKRASDHGPSGLSLTVR